MLLPWNDGLDDSSNLVFCASVKTLKKESSPEGISESKFIIMFTEMVVRKIT